LGGPPHLVLSRHGCAQLFRQLADRERGAQLCRRGANLGLDPARVHHAKPHRLCRRAGLFALIALQLRLKNRIGRIDSVFVFSE